MLSPSPRRWSASCSRPTSAGCERPTGMSSRAQTSTQRVRAMRAFMRSASLKPVSLQGLDCKFAVTTGTWELLLGELRARLGLALERPEHVRDARAHERVGDLVDDELGQWRWERDARVVLAARAVGLGDEVPAALGVG